MDRIFDVESWDTLTIAREPATPSIVLPLKILLATQSVTALDLMLTVPPEVYPEGITTVPAFVSISPLVLPLFAILPETEPDAPKPVLPVSKSPAARFAPDVS